MSSWQSILLGGNGNGQKVMNGLCVSYNTCPRRAIPVVQFSFGHTITSSMARCVRGVGLKKSRWLVLVASHWLPIAQNRRVSMQNVSFQVQDNQLVITVDLDQELGVSSSGKSIIIATTGGNVALTVPGYDEIKVGVNVYRPQQQQYERGSRRMASQ
ncbi:MAG: hypothetical protein ACR2H5_13245 [Ktedonobacteraceae bacterium]